MDNLKLFNIMYWISIVMAIVNGIAGQYAAGTVWLAISAIYLVGEVVVKEIRAK